MYPQEDTFPAGEQSTYGVAVYTAASSDPSDVLPSVHVVYRLSDRFMLVVNASNREKIVEWIGRHSAPFGTGVRDETRERKFGFTAAPGGYLIRR